MLGVSQEYFEDTFPVEMSAKVADIPDENLITPPTNRVTTALGGGIHPWTSADHTPQFMSRMRKQEHPTTFPDDTEEITRLSASG
jgi:hypothetical protein